MKSFFLASAILILVVFHAALHGAPPVKKTLDDGFKPVPRAALDVSDGQVGETADGFLTIDSPEVRATEQAAGAKGARLTFVYRGATREVSKLASGAVAHQIGLKLRAKNTCNLLYAMWKLEGETTVAVSVKRNPGMSTHQECGANGYINVQPTFRVTRDKFPDAGDGKPHTLEARLFKHDANSFEFVVKADGAVAWEGSIDAALLNDIDGPAGFRTDNAAFTFRFASLEASQVQFGPWKEDKKKDRFVCEYKYPLNNGLRFGAQQIAWYPNDPERKDYYYFATKTEQIWARCLCPNSSAYNRKELKWSVPDKTNWTDLPDGACPAPKDGHAGRAAIDAVPNLPAAK